LTAATGRLDQGGDAGLDLAVLLRGFNQRQANAVLDAGRRVPALQLDGDACWTSLAQAVQVEQRGLSNQFGDAVGNRHGFSVWSPRGEPVAAPPLWREPDIYQMRLSRKRRENRKPTCRYLWRWVRELKR
jgi:hypothetical protein